MAAIADLKNSGSMGSDGISSVLLKRIAENIVNPLLYISNLSFTSGTFPDHLKISKIVPIYKKGVLSDPNNYRAISIISPLSKLLE
jgi:hypothetical protein